MTGIKHLIQCHCILPQYKGSRDPVFHKFVVFSILNDDDTIVVKLAQCNNCGVLHKITDLCKSELVLGHDESRSLPNLSDLKLCLPSGLVSILESHNCDLPTWEEAKFLIDNSLWNRELILEREMIGDSTQIKVLTINDKGIPKIDTHIRDEFIR